jgi:import inner membrane translocase subunit TIM44
MISAAKFSGSARTAAILRGQAFRSANSHNIAFHRLLNQAQSTINTNHASKTSFTPAVAPYLRRSLHSTSILSQKQQEKESDANNQKGKTQEQELESEGDDKKDGQKEGESEDKKKDAPPPPPHGDKTPWQVFTETLQTEFKKSKEWEESTKALASSAHQFTESDSVKRARAAYEAASSTASSGTASALKSTGKAIGQGAAWTWDTPVVKGLRKGVTVTGKGIEKATRPVRETEAYKTAVGGVKDAIDDGSSSRYGGWVEKEERRRQRELREQNSGRRGKAEKMEEDPE